MSIGVGIIAGHVAGAHLAAIPDADGARARAVAIAFERKPRLYN
jgi:hypothetical protein